MKIECVSLPHKYDVIQPFITTTTKKKTENENNDAPRITHSI
jgi:hypothetical protein